MDRDRGYAGRRRTRIAIYLGINVYTMHNRAW